MKRKILCSITTAILLLSNTSICASAAWKQSGGQWHWTNQYGLNCTGWNQIDGKWYFFDNSGNMKTGLTKIGQDTFYLNNNGEMQKGWVQTDNSWYYFDESGVMQSDKLVDGYYLGENGVMQLKENNKVIVDNELVKVTYVGVNKDSVNGPKIKLLIENKSGKNICIQNRSDAKIDGTAKNAAFNEEIKIGSSVLGNFVLPQGTAKDFKNITGEFKIMEDGTWTLLKTQEFEMNF